jgi:hypothetical protein
MPIAARSADVIGGRCCPFPWVLGPDGALVGDLGEAVALPDARAFDGLQEADVWSAGCSKRRSR